MAESDVEFGSINIHDTVRLLLNFDEEVQHRSKHRSESIYMVSDVYRNRNPYCFTPRVVSIGPLHHQDEHLIGFEVQKATYMHNLVHNVLSPWDSTPDQIIKACVTRVSGSIDRIKACYIGMPTYPDSELVKMMVMDACFILAFIHNSFVVHDSSLVQNVLHYSHTFFDMVLIENQIPFFVLQDIFECTFSKLLPTVPLADFILGIRRVCNIFEGDLVIKNSIISSTHNHILGFLHKSYQNPDRDSSIIRKMVRAHSVVELDRSGVRFSKKLDAKWPMAMELEFSRFLCFPLSWTSWYKPTLKMPVLRMHQQTELFIRNLIIYENTAEVPTCVTSYMQAMDRLIDTPQDVAEMVKSQVLDNYLGSDEEAADIINRICKDFPVKDFYYQDEWKQMDDYYHAYWPNSIAELKRNYFSNPWSIIALVSGIVLFVLTVVQTIYGVKAA